MDGLPNPAPPPAIVQSIPGIDPGRALCPDHLVIARPPAAPPPTAPPKPAPWGLGAIKPPCENTIYLSKFRPSFDDEFDSLRLFDAHTGKGVWKTTFIHGPQVGPYAWDSRTLRNNHELEIYVDPDFPGMTSAPLGLNPFEVNHGVLTINADKIADSAKWKLWGYAYSSGLLTTQLSFAQRYGYFEIRAKLPAGHGVWPAFWLLPTDATWPPELDVLEQTGGEEVLQTVHTNQDGAPEQTGFRVIVNGDTTGFHTYGVLWTADRIVWFVDGRETARAPTPTDMHKPMYMLLNLAIGGSLPGDPDEHQAWPARFMIKSVRAYSMDAMRGGR